MEKALKQIKELIDGITFDDISYYLETENPEEVVVILKDLLFVFKINNEKLANIRSLLFSDALKVEVRNDEILIHIKPFIDINNKVNDVFILSCFSNESAVTLAESIKSKIS